MAAECCSSCEYQRTVGYPSTSWASCQFTEDCLLLKAVFANAILTNIESESFVIELLFLSFGVVLYRPNLCCDCCPWQTFALSALTHPPSGDLPLSVSDSSYGSSTIIYAQSKTTNEALLRNISVHFMFHGWQPLRRVAEFRRTSHLQFTS